MDEGKSIPTRQGFLMKQETKADSWEKQWFVLSKDTLAYYVSEVSPVPKGVVPLDADWTVHQCEVEKQCYGFRLVSPKVSNQTLTMLASTEEDRSNWMRDISCTVSALARHNRSQGRLDDARAVFNQALSILKDAGAPTSNSISGDFGFEMLNLVTLPEDVLMHIFTYVDAQDHLALAVVCKTLRNMYTNDGVWQRLAFQYFPHESRLREQHLAVGHGPPEADPSESPRPSMSIYRVPSWQQTFKNCTHTLQGLMEGCFARTQVWEHHIPSSPLLVDYQVFQIGDVHVFMERSVAYSGQTRFLFRSLTESEFHFEWKINMGEIFPNFNPLRNRIHSDIRVKNGFLMLAFYSTNGTLARLYHWAVSSLEDLRLIPKTPLQQFWTPDALASQEASATCSSEPASPYSCSPSHSSSSSASGTPRSDESASAPPAVAANTLADNQIAPARSMRLLRLQPPFAALQAQDFVLVNVVTGKVIFVEPNTEGAVQTCRWDSGRLIFIIKHANKKQHIHIVPLPSLAAGFNSAIDRFSHPHDHTNTHSSTPHNRIVIPCKFKLSGSYLDFFHTSAGLAIFASTVSRTFCKICVGTRCDNPLNCAKHPLQQSLFVIEKETSPGSSSTSTTTSDDMSSFTTPKGLLFGNCGPFIAFSDGCDVFWFVDKGNMSQPVARKIRVGMGQACTGHHQVVILGSSLLHICSKHTEQIREVSLYEPCTDLMRKTCCEQGPRRFALSAASLQSNAT